MSSYLIEELFKETEINKIILPNFQRDFEWKKEKQQNFLASVMTSIPFGSLLILKGKKDSFKSREIGVQENLDTSDINAEPLFVLDGQQRTTCLKSFFSDFFEAYPAGVQKNLFPGIQNRWFIKLDANNSDFFGFKYLKFDSESQKNSIPDDILELIICKSGNSISAKSKSPYKLINPLNKQKAYFISENYIPIQLLYKHVNTIEEILRDIARNRRTVLDNELDKQEKIQILKLTNPNIEKLFNYIEIEKDDSKRNELNKELESVWIEHWMKWVQDVLSYLKSILKIKVPCTILEEENLTKKASVIFQNINQGGTPLSTFDLFTAKFFTNDLRLQLKNQIQKPLTNLPKDLSKVTEWRPDYFSLLDSKGKSFSNKFQDQFLNTLSVLTYIEKKDVGIDKLSTNHNKKDNILILDQADITKNFTKAVNGLLRTYCFLQLRCGLRKIEDISYELLILPISIILSDDSYWGSKSSSKRKVVFDQLEYFYWLSIFSGRYSKEQNKRCIEDIKRVYAWIHNKKNISNEIGPSSDLFKRILDLEDFVTKKILTQKDPINTTPNAIENNILFYILSKQPDDLDLENKKYPKLSSLDVAQGKYKIEIHHIIPLTNGKKTIKQSTLEIRNDKKHELNSVLNKTFIREESNRYISDLDTNKYINEIVKNFGTLPLTVHCITNDKKLLSGNPQSNINFLNTRFTTLLHDIQKHLNNLFSSI